MSSIAAEALALAQAQVASPSGPPGSEGEGPPTAPSGPPSEGPSEGPPPEGPSEGLPPEGGGARREKLSWDQEVAKLPPELQSLARGLQGMVTKKTQALADERKALAAERDAWRKSIGKLATPPAGDALPDVDAWDPASIQARIEAEVGRRLADALAPVESEYRAAQADLEFDRFSAAHPDLLDDPEVKSGVADLLKRNDSIDLETAYFAVKGRLGRRSPHAGPLPAPPGVDPRRAAARKAAETVAAPRRPPTSSAPPKMSPADLKKATPEQILAMARAMAERR